LRGDLLEHLSARGLKRQLIDHDLIVLDFVTRPEAQSARSTFVDLRNVLAARDELATGRKIRTLDMFQQLRGRRLRFIEKMDDRCHDLTQIVRWDIRRHADCDATRTVEK